MSLLLSLLFLAADQKKLPPANPIPLDGSEEAAVIAPVTAMLAGITARDGAAILAQTRPEGRVTVAVEGADGGRSFRHLSWGEFAAEIKPGTARLDERLAQPAIEIDGDIAMIWAPYSFTLDGKMHHCGTKLFDLTRADGRWAILNVTYTHRTTGCEGR